MRGQSRPNFNKSQRVGFQVEPEMAIAKLGLLRRGQRCCAIQLIHLLLRGIERRAHGRERPQHISMPGIHALHSDVRIRINMLKREVDGLSSSLLIRIHEIPRGNHEAAACGFGDDDMFRRVGQSLAA